MSCFEVVPIEIFCKIFDHLSLADVKNASLTCRRWCDIIFSEFYIGRFQLIIFLIRVDHCWMLRPDGWPYMHGISSTTVTRFFPPSLYQLYRKVLGKSNCNRRQLSLMFSRSCRRYCHIEFRYYNNRSKFGGTAIDVLQKLLTPRGLEQVKVLRISMLSNVKCSDFAPVNNFTMRNLLLNYFPKNVSQQMILPKLESLDCTLINCGEEEFCTQTFGQLKTLKLSITFELWSERALYATQLEAWILHPIDKLHKLISEDASTPEHIFQAICETSCNLEELYIGHLQVLDCSVLNKLSLLQNLKKLSLEKISTPCEKLFHKVYLPQLESLHLDVSKDFSHSVANFRNLKHLELGSTTETAYQVFDAIWTNNLNLQELKLHFINSTANVPPRTFRNLGNLKHLRKLELFKGSFSRSTFDQCPAGASNLEMMEFYSCRIMIDDFNALRYRFCELKKMHTDSWQEVSDGMVIDVQRDGASSVITFE